MQRILLYLLIFISTIFVGYAQSTSFTLNSKQKLQFIGVYAGATSVLQDKVTDFAMNANYEYRFVSSNFGFGLFTEFLFGNYTEILFGFPVYFHKISPINLRICFAPGIAITKRIKYMMPNGQVTELEPTYNTSNFMLRFGLGWEQFIYRDDIPIVAVTPLMNLDFVSENKTYLVIGATITWIIH